MGNKGTAINKETFARFFFEGIENKEELEEGILYFSLHNVYKKHSEENWFEIPNEQIVEEMIEQAKGKYKQYYRFIKLNDKINSMDYDVNMEKIVTEIKEKLQKFIEEGKVIWTKAGVLFVREEEQRLQGGTYFDLKKGIQGEEGWTKQMYRIFTQLEQLEKENIMKYYEYWLKTKMQRSIHRDIPDDDERKMITKAFEVFEKRKQEQIEKEQQERR